KGRQPGRGMASQARGRVPFHRIPTSAIPTDRSLRALRSVRAVPRPDPGALLVMCTRPENRPTSREPGSGLRFPQATRPPPSPAGAPSAPPEGTVDDQQEQPPGTHRRADKGDQQPHDVRGLAALLEL